MTSGTQRFYMGEVACSTHTIPELLAELQTLLRDKTPTPRTILTLNAHIYNLAARDVRLQRNLNAARVVTADGMGIVWASRLFGVRIPRRCNMTEALRAFLAAPQMPPNRAVLIGCTPEEARAAAAEMNRHSQHCRVEQSFSGYLSEDEYREICAHLDGVDLILLGMGTPRTEAVAELAARNCPGAIVWGIGGGTVRILAGTMREAPRMWRRLGLQWLHRLILEPSRLWRRYLIGNPLFVWRVMKAAWVSRRWTGIDFQGRRGLEALQEFKRVNVLGVGISAVNLHLALGAIAAALERRLKGYVCFTSVHGVMEAQRDERMRDILNEAFLTTPDGMPLVWVGKLNGFRGMNRVYGPDLMLLVCEFTRDKKYTHYLYGGVEGVAHELKQRLEARFPGVHIAGTYTPPFRPLTATEEAEMIGEINALKPDILWVGLSTPKQEKFMAQYLSKLDVTLMFGVGAAFDFHSGRVRQAPRWMQRSGLEWLFRLLQEPRRLWRRYFTNNPLFVVRIFGQLFGLKKYALKRGDVPRNS